MRLKEWMLVAALMLLPAAAQAQVFTAGSLFFTPDPSLPASQRFGRFLVGAYVASWDFAEIPVAGAADLDLEPSLSPLITVDYFLTRRLSIGGWYNPISGELNGRLGSTKFKLADEDALFTDFHATYYLADRPLTRGVSIQAGYSVYHYDLEVAPVLRQLGARNLAFTEFSPNIWVNKTQQLGAPEIRGRRYPVALFGSFGYYTSTDFDTDVNLIFGTTVQLRKSLNLNASVWLNGLDSDQHIRVTAGFSGRF
jgi:hypothetical protein